MTAPPGSADRPRSARLLAFARELQRVSTFEDLLLATQAEIVAAVGYTHAWVFVADREDPNRWRLIDIVGARGGAVREVAPILEVNGDPMLEEIARGDVPVVVADARTDPRTDKRIVEQLGNRTIVNIPLRLLDEPLGAFGTGTFGDEGCRPPTPDQLDYLIGMASQLSVAAGRIRFLEERQLAEDALRRSEEDLRLTLESIGDAVVTTDVTGRIIRVNPVAERLTGWAAIDAHERNLREVFELLDERTRLALESPVDRVVRDGTIVGPGSQAILVARDGTSHAVAYSGAPMRDAEGELRGVVLVFREQTEERKAVRALRESEARKTAMMEAALDAIVTMDHEGKITEFNAAAERTFGYSRREVIGRVLGDILVPEALRALHTNGLRSYLQTNEAHVLGKRIEVSALRRDGTEFPAEVAILRIPGEDPPVFTGYIRDITERKRAAEAELLRRAKEAAEEANAELEAFSYSVAHDLRSPLRGISGFSTTLLEDYGDKLDAEALRRLKRIVAGALRMSQIIDALLSLARLTRAEPRRGSVSLSELAAAIVAQLRADEPKRDVEIVIAQDLVVLGDQGLLRVLMENLLGNAWKFTGKRSPARIEVGRIESVDKDGPTYFVRDNGAGFDMTHAKQLFAPFHRLHAASEFEGVGVGLATVQRIVRRHGGTIWAEAREGHGATFYFTLPASGPTQASWAPEP
ncbi:MAG TPA: PAS domain S-box protein [Labilithrix sp.]|nr:PAS domain S-box protein [Labilithrix sp.]